VSRNSHFIAWLTHGYPLDIQAFFGPTDATRKSSLQFNDWLKATILEGNLQDLTSWESAPGSRMCHPREEHLLPLLVVAGAAVVSDKTQLVYDTTSDIAEHHVVSGYLFG
jgi:aromatic ring-opening dioxygenase catalytic subunit (LigB family)